MIHVRILPNRYSENSYGINPHSSYGSIETAIEKFLYVLKDGKVIYAFDTDAANEFMTIPQNCAKSRQLSKGYIQRLPSPSLQVKINNAYMTVPQNCVASLDLIGVYPGGQVLHE